MYRNVVRFTSMTYTRSLPSVFFLLYVEERVKTKYFMKVIKLLLKGSYFRNHFMMILTLIFGLSTILELLSFNFFRSLKILFHRLGRFDEYIIYILRSFE